MNAYAEAAAGVRGATVEASNGLCAASGCCLPGTMSLSTHGTKEWWCRVHFQTPRPDHDGITARISNRAELFGIALVLVNEGWAERVDQTTRKKLHALGRPEFPGLGDVTAYAMGSHMLEVLGKECRAPQAHMGVPSSGTTWVDAATPEEIDL